jgi:hypothetical protein
MAMLPPLPQRIISFATAWAVMNTPGNCSQHLQMAYSGPSSITSNIDLEHHVGVRLCVIKSRSLLLDTGCGDQTIESALCVTNALDNRVEALHVSDVDLAVVESVACAKYVSSRQLKQSKQMKPTKLFSSSLLHSVEVRTRLWQPIECIHRRASLEQCLSLH